MQLNLGFEWEACRVACESGDVDDSDSTPMVAV